MCTLQFTAAVSHGGASLKYFMFNLQQSIIFYNLDVFYTAKELCLSSQKYTIFPQIVEKNDEVAWNNEILKNAHVTQKICTSELHFL